MSTFSTVAISLFSALLFFCGYFFGKWKSVAEIKSLLKVRKNSYLLGQMVKDDEQKKGMAQAYYDSETALREMDTYNWDATALILSPFVGYAPAPAKEKDFQINSNQFRAAENIISPKQKNAYRLFLVGGSTAFGSGAPDQERTIGGYLKTHLKNNSSKEARTYEVFTVAAAAWSSAHERIAIENLVSEMEPNIIVSLSGNNDAHWGWNFKNTMWFRSYADNHFWKLINAANASAGYETIADPIENREKVLPPEEIARIMKKNVDVECHILSSAGAKHYFLLQPIIPLTGKALTVREKKILSAWHPDQIDYHRECFKLIAIELKSLEQKYEHFHFFDFTGVFDDLTMADEVFLDSYHFGDKGYDIISKCIYKLIRGEVA